jgi:hypothetical protein
MRHLLADSSFSLGDSYGFGHGSGQVTSLSGEVSKLLPPAFALAGVGVTMYFIFGAFKLITSGGEKNAVAEAQKMITHAIIGFVMLIILFAVLKFLPAFFNLGINIIQ